MKKPDDKKLDEMLYNIYNSKADRVFHFSAEENTEDHKVYKSRAEQCRRKSFSHSKVCAIAAACLITVGVGTIFFEDIGSSRNPASTSEISTDETADYQIGTAIKSGSGTEQSVFEQYLEEFEYETSNFDYECIKVTANPEPDSFEENQNRFYADLCYDMNIVPAYENCTFIDSDNSNQSIAVTDEDFYFYIKKTDAVISENDSETADSCYTRQSYLIWKDSDGTITKIRPSSEKVSAKDIQNMPEFNNYYNLPYSEIENIMQNFADEDYPVYIDDVLVRPAVPEENQIGEPSVEVSYDYRAYVYYNGQFVPVNAQTLYYSTSSVMYFGDEYKETENIPFFNAKIDENSDISMKKTIIWDCSGDEPVDISSYIVSINDTYWFETAVRTESSADDEAENQVIDKDYILNHMLNSMDFFDTAEGEFVSYETGSEYDVSFSANCSDDISERFVLENYYSYDDAVNTERFRMNNLLYENTNDYVYYDYSPLATDDYIPVEERLSAWIYRDNMDMIQAKKCLMYQELVFYCLYDTSLWDITDETTMFGYDGIVIEGKTNSGSFKIVVEKNTGIILDYEEYTGNELTAYIRVNNISIDNGLSVDKTELEKAYKEKIQNETTEKNQGETVYFSDLASMNEESINNLIDKCGDALQRTDTGFTLCSYCLEQSGIKLSDMKIYPDCDLSMDILEFYNSANTQNKLYCGVCYDIPGLGSHEAVVTPDENNQYSGYDYENYKVQIIEDNYLITVHFPNSAADIEKEINEKFHNMPWAEIEIY